VLFPPESCYLVANKKVMAWISEGLPWMDEADRSLVRRYLPWTRVVEERKVEWRGDSHDLGDLLIRHQEDLVLKKATGMMGLEVTLGSACAPGAWAAEVARALADGDTIVQEHVVPGRYRLEASDGPGDGTHPADVIPVLSPCLYDGRAGGCFVRYHRSGRAGVIGASRFGAVENVMVAAR